MLRSCQQTPISLINSVEYYLVYWSSATSELKGNDRLLVMLRVLSWAVGCLEKAGDFRLSLMLSHASSLWVWSPPRLFEACPDALKSGPPQLEPSSPMVKREVHPCDGLNLFFVNADIVPWTDNFLTKLIEPSFCYI